MAPAESSGAVVLDFQIPCDLSQVRPAGEQARLFLTRENWPADGVIDAELALVEACNNAVKYAQGPARELPISIRIMLRDSELQMEVTDHTAGFDWPQQAALPDPSAESGRGVFLIQSVMDQTEYVRSHNANTLLMRRRRPQLS